MKVNSGFTDGNLLGNLCIRLPDRGFKFLVKDVVRGEGRERDSSPDLLISRTAQLNPDVQNRRQMNSNLPFLSG